MIIETLAENFQLCTNLVQGRLCHLYCKYRREMSLTWLQENESIGLLEELNYFCV